MANQVVKQREGGAVSPVKVIQNQHQARRCGQLLQESPDGGPQQKSCTLLAFALGCLAPVWRFGDIWGGMPVRCVGELRQKFLDWTCQGGPVVEQIAVESISDCSPRLCGLYWRRLTHQHEPSRARDVRQRSQQASLAGPQFAGQGEERKSILLDRRQRAIELSTDVALADQWKLTECMRRLALFRDGDTSRAPILPASAWRSMKRARGS